MRYTSRRRRSDSTEAIRRAQSESRRRTSLKPTRLAKPGEDSVRCPDCGAEVRAGKSRKPWFPVVHAPGGYVADAVNGPFPCPSSGVIAAQGRRSDT